MQRPSAGVWLWHNGDDARTLEVLRSHSSHPAIADLRRSRENVIRVTVVDNASIDGSPERLATTFPEIEVIASPTNVGFASAADRGLASSSADWLLVVNPDVEVRPESISASVAYLEQHPAAGMCCLRAVDERGAVNDRSFFAFPSLRSELTLALGLHRVAPASRWWNPEQYVAHRPIAGPTDVEAIAGCFTVVERTLWDHLHGYDESYSCAERTWI